MSKILKFLAAAAVVAVAYKVGEAVGKDKKIKLPNLKPNGFDLDNLLQEKTIEIGKQIDEEVQNEIDLVESLIEELKSKKDKTPKDRNNIGLLEVKLQQLKKK